MDRYIFIGFVISIVTFVLGVYIGSSSISTTEQTYLCKQTKSHTQTNMIVMECIENE